MSISKLSQLVLSDYQVRKTKKQKEAFIELLQKELGDNHNIVVEKGGSFGSRNIVAGDLENCEYVLTAHYDTAPVLPFPNFITPKNLLFYLLYNVMILIPIAIIYGIVSWVLSFFGEFGVVNVLLMYVLLFGQLGLMMAGPANKHTVNDNTSGVVTLIEVLYNDALKDKVCCVFFDHEEAGLLGSTAFASKHKALMKTKKLVNFDCVSDGDNLMFIFSKSMRKEQKMFENAFKPAYGKVCLFEKSSTTIYPSDQANFKNSVGVAALKKNKVLGYYLDKIHTKNDTNFDEKNIILLIQGLERLCNC